MDAKNTPPISMEPLPPGFELRYTLRGHGGTIYSLVWSPDGQLLASGAADNTIRLWDAQTGKLRRAVKHPSVVSILAWSPAGRILASGLWDHAIYLWDAQNGELARTLDHDSVVSSMAWSPDGRTLAAGTTDRTICLWDAGSGELQRTLAGHDDGIISLAWSPDGRLLASGSDDRKIQLWDAQSGNLCGALQGHQAEVISLSWSPDGQFLCSGSMDETILLWDGQTGDLRRTYEGYYGNLETIAWSPDGRILAAGAWNETIHLFDPQSLRELKVLAGHANRILCLRFSVDGGLLASKSKDQTIRFWRCTDWQPVGVLNAPGSPIFGGLAFHPHAPILATRGEGDQIHVWQLDPQLLLPPLKAAEVPSEQAEEFILLSDTSDFLVGADTAAATAKKRLAPEAVPAGFELRHTLSGHAGVVCDVVWSPDGELLATASADQTIRIHNGESGELVQTLAGHADTVDGVAWSPDGRKFASVSTDRTIRFWDVGAGNLLQTLEGHHEGVITLAWSPDSQFLASGSRDKTVRFWDGATGELLRTLEGHAGPVYCVAWSPDGRLLASASFDQTMRLWDGRNGEFVRMLDGHGGAVTSVAWSPDATLLAAGFADNTIQFWDALTGQQRMILEGHTDSILCVRFSPNGRLLASKSYDSTIRLWQAESGELLAILIEPTALMDFSGLAFHPQLPMLATRGAGDKLIRVWCLDAQTFCPGMAWPAKVPAAADDLSAFAEAVEGLEGQAVFKEKLPPGFELLQTFREVEGIVSEMAWSPDGRLLAAASADHTVWLWNVPKGTLLRKFAGHGDWVSSVAWSPDGEMLASGAFDRSVRLWHAETGECLQRLEGHHNDVSSVAWSPDGQIVASSSRDQTIRLWSAQSGELIQVFEGHRGPVYAVKWLPDGKTLVSASFDKTIRCWDVPRGVPRIVLKGHAGPITSIAVSPDGLTLASGSHDNTIRLWQTETGRLVSILEDHTDTVLGVCFSPDGLLLASKSFDHTVRLWRCDSGNLVAVLPETVDVLNFAGLSFQPGATVLATRGEEDRIIRLWRLDYSILLGAEALGSHWQIPPAPGETTVKEPSRVASMPAALPPVSAAAPPEPAPPEPENAPAGFTLRRKLSRQQNLIAGLAWSPNGNMLAAGTQEQVIGLWDAQTGKLRRVLEGHEGPVTSVTWSPDGQWLASGSADATVRVWNPHSGQLAQTFAGHTDGVLNVAWAPDGLMLASGADDQTVRLWDSHSGELLWTFQGHSAAVTCVAWAPDAQRLASGSFDNTIRLWDAARGVLCRTFEGHSGAVTSVAWAPDAQILAAGLLDHTVRLWNVETGRQVSILEGHTDLVLAVCFSADGRLLASKSDDQTVRLWHGDSGEPIAVLDEPTSVMNFGGLAFHPAASVLATRGAADKAIRIWQLDYDTLFQSAPHSHARYYRNAKIVLVGDSGTGKSGLALVLTGKGWEATESTHGRHVWTFDSQEAILPSGQRETREILLWDLAGQADYRLLHQLYLNEVVVAVVVFDAASPIEAFAGVRHWGRALHQAHRLQSNATLPLKKFLVAARCDRGGLQISRERIDGIIKKFVFEGFFETSAKEGWQIPELIAAIREAIDWETLPRVSSSELFQIIKQFIVEQKQAGHLLLTGNDLYRALGQAHPEFAEDPNLRSKFDTCLSRVENRDLIRRLNFGSYVLLQPELLDAYASALINAARSQPDGLGFIPEEDALSGNFKMSADERVTDQNQERLLLIATVEELLRHELILKESTDARTDLVFPSQITREQPESAELPPKAVVFAFEGPLLNIYATLTVRLSQSGIFGKKERWKNVATYTAAAGGLCGIVQEELEEGQGELTLCFDEPASDATRQQFEDYVVTHLKRLALPNTIQRRRIIACQECGEVIPDSMLKRLRERGRAALACPICAAEIPLVEGAERPVDTQTLTKMDQTADAQRERDTAAMVLKGKVHAGDFDVFLCHNSKDKTVVKTLGEQLKARGLLPWVDEWEFRPGFPWQKTLEAEIDKIKSAAVFIGPQGFGPWQDMEIDAFLRKFVSRKCPVIPVILEGCEGLPKLPVFLEGMMWVDFRRKEPDPMEQLIWGITGEKRII